MWGCNTEESPLNRATILSIKNGTNKRAEQLTGHFLL